jgi:integrase
MDMRVAPPREAETLLAAVPDNDRAVWATAMYAGLRRGELMGLTVECIDLRRRIIRVECGWDEREGSQETKGRERRVVPIPSMLSDLLLSHLARTGRKGKQLAFGVTGGSPFVPMSVRKRADDAWAAAGLKRITLHQCRHTYASFLIAAGVNAKAVQTYMGHSSITITFDTYGHLFPGNEEETAGLLDAHLAAQVAS